MLLDYANLEHDAVTLPTIHLGAPTHTGALTFFPVWTDAPVPKKATAITPPKTAAIGELDEGPTVGLLQVTNPTAVPFVLLEGTIVDGGWQHRVVVHDVLVGAGQQLHVPVRCVEQGRWGGASTQRVSRRRAPLGVAGALRGIGKTRHDAVPSARANQGEVWDRVSSIQARVGADAPTGSMVDVFAHVEIAESQRAGAPAPLPGQRGVLVGVEGHPALLELFDHPRTFEKQWDGLVQSLLASTTHVSCAPTPGRRARAFVDRLSRRPLPFVDRAGDARLAEDVDDLVSVRCLVADGGAGLHTAALNIRHRLVLSA